MTTTGSCQQWYTNNNEIIATIGSGKQWDRCSDTEKIQVVFCCCQNTEELKDLSLLDLF
jgi:hypothetical protein